MSNPTDDRASAGHPGVSFSGASGSMPDPASRPTTSRGGPSTVTDGAPERVIVFDTTLRDGEQSPGASMNLGQKLQVARALRDLGVDVIEAGFAAASPGDLESIQAVSRQVEGVKLARERFDDVEFSAEGSARTELEFLAEVVERFIEAGAGTVNIPDTVGYALPTTYAETIRYLRKHVRGIDRVVISVHCHNDLGLAVANSLAGVVEGARQVECTINGIGERAGNASLEEIVMALKTRHDVLGLRTGVRTERLYPTSRLVSQVTGLHVQRNKAIVGQNAFAHEAGIHQHGMLTHRETYEIMRPEEVGFARSQLVLGKHSGRHALKDRLVALGYQLDETQVDKVFADFKVLADKKKDIYDADIEALVVHGQILGKGSVAWTLEALSTTSGTGTLPCASIALRSAGGERVLDAAVGDGPVDAVYRAVEKVTGISVKLRDYQVLSVSKGEDAQGEVSVEVEHATGVYRGRALSTDIIEGSARAFLDVVNRIALKTGNGTPAAERVETMGTV